MEGLPRNVSEFTRSRELSRQNTPTLSKATGAFGLRHYSRGMSGFYDQDQERIMKMLASGHKVRRPIDREMILNEAERQIAQGRNDRAQALLNLVR